MSTTTTRSASTNPAALERGVRMTPQLALPLTGVVLRMVQHRLVVATTLSLMKTRKEKEAFVSHLQAGAVFSGNGLGQILEFLHTGRANVLWQINDFDLFLGVDASSREDWHYNDPYYGRSLSIPPEFKIHMAPPVYTGRVSLVEIAVDHRGLVKMLQSNRMGNWVDFYLTKETLTVGDWGAKFLATRKLVFNHSNQYREAAAQRLARKAAQGYETYAALVSTYGNPLTGLNPEEGTIPYGYCLKEDGYYYWGTFELESLNLNRAYNLLLNSSGGVDKDFVVARCTVSYDELYTEYQRAELDSGVRHPSMRFVFRDNFDRGYQRAVPTAYRAERGALVVQQDIVELGWMQAVALPYTWEMDGSRVVFGHYPELGFAPAENLPYFGLGGLIITEEVRKLGLEPAEPLPSAVLLGALHPYNASPLQVLGVPTPGAELAYGLELESCSLTSTARLWVHSGGFIWKVDGSCGVELVSVPMSLEDLCSAIMASNIHLLNPDKDCGMHVHVNRAALTQRQQCLLALLLSDEEYSDEIQRMAGRGYNSYCKKVDKKTEQELLSSDDRYEAVNLTNYSEGKYTVEIRIFAGTNSKDEVCRRLHWVDMLVKFVKSDHASDRYGDFVAWSEASF